MAETLCDSYSEANQDGGNWCSDIITNHTHKSGQSFTGNGSNLSSAKFYLRRGGAISGNGYAELYAHSGTFGTSSIGVDPVLATSDGEAVSEWSTSYTLKTFTFSGANRVLLTNATKYVIVFRYIEGTAGTIEIGVGWDASSPSHGGNQVEYSTQNGWQYSANYDVCFYVYTQPVPKVGGFSGGQPWIFMKDTLDKGKKYFKDKALWLPDDILFRPELTIAEEVK